MTLELTKTTVEHRFATSSYITVKLPQNGSRQARVYVERGYLQLGITERDGATNEVIREEKGGWVRSDNGRMFVAFVFFAETELLAFADSSNHVAGAGWSPEEAVLALRKEVRQINAGKLQARWEHKGE